jgi:hypothetical protein
VGGEPAAAGHEGPATATKVEMGEGAADAAAAHEGQAAATAVDRDVEEEAAAAGEQATRGQQHQLTATKVEMGRRQQQPTRSKQRQQ